jgi:hypothetical protein
MCFSAEASFAVGTVLMASSAYCLSVACRKDKRFVPVALVPFFFAIQQFCEGAVWLGATSYGSFGFLFFAIAFWPVWMPLCIFNVTRSFYVLPFILGGTLWGLVIYVPIVVDPILLEVNVVRHSIQYNLVGWSNHSPLLLSLYLLTTVVPAFFSSNVTFWFLGIFAIVTAVFCELALGYAVVSLWCFFAAITSASLVFCFYNLTRRSS